MNRAQLDQLHADLATFRDEHAYAFPNGDDQRRAAIDHIQGCITTAKASAEASARAAAAQEGVTLEDMRAAAETMFRVPEQVPVNAVEEILLRLDALLDSRLLCTACLTEHHQRAANGVTDDHNPPPNVGQLIVTDPNRNPGAACLEHVQFSAGPVLPGQRPSGIFLPGAGG